MEPVEIPGGGAWDEVRRLVAQVRRLELQRDAALAEVRHLSRVNEREWADYLRTSERLSCAEAQVRAVEALCAPPVGEVAVLSIRAALATAARRASAHRLPDADRGTPGRRAAEG